jgi:hypothetical protein
MPGADEVKDPERFGAEVRERLSTGATTLYRRGWALCLLAGPVQLIAVFRALFSGPALATTRLFLSTLIFFGLVMAMILRMAWEVWHLADVWLLATAIEVQREWSTVRIPLTRIRRIDGPRWWTAAIRLRFDPASGGLRQVTFLQRGNCGGLFPGLSNDARATLARRVAEATARSGAPRE